MKKNIQKIGTSFTDKKIKAHINEQNLIGQSNAKLSATTHILEGKPPLKGSSLKNFTQSIYNFYSTLIEEVNSLIQSKLHVQLGTEQKQEKLSKDKDVQHQIAKEESTIVNNTKIGCLQVILLLLEFGLYLCISLFLFLGDWMYLSRSLQMIMDTYKGSLYLGLTISLSIIGITHLSEHWISTYIQQRIIRKIVRISIWTLIISMFFGLGIYRKQFIEESTGHESPLLVFVGINILLYLAIFLIMQLNLNPMIPKLRETFKGFFNLLKFNRKQRRIAKLKAKLIQNREELNENLGEKLSIISFHRSCELLIERNYFQAISTYKETIINGSVNEIPECLDDEIPPLKKHTDEFEPKNDNENEK